MKPNWEAAPAWANWLAMDDDGEWFWYQIKPKYSASNGYWHSKGRCTQAVAAEKSLEKRPS